MGRQVWPGRFLRETAECLRTATDPVIGLAIVAVIAAAWFPVSWFWRTGIHGEIPAGLDGPASWIALWWFRIDSPALFQPAVPFVSLWVAWARREEIISQIRRAHGASPGRGLWDWIPFLPTGLAVLSVAHLTHVPTLAVAGLQCICVGLVQSALGATSLRAARVPLFLVTTLTFPPETVMGVIRDVPAGWFARAVAEVVNRIGQTCSADGSIVQTAAGAMDFGAGRCLSAVSTGAAFAVLAIGLARRSPVAAIGAGMAGCLGVVFSLEFGACVAATLLKPKFPTLAATLLSPTAWAWFLPGLLAGCAATGWFAKRTRGAREVRLASGATAELDTDPPRSSVLGRLAGRSRKRLAVAALAVFGVGAAGTWSTTRLLAAGTWMPAVPEAIGDWEGTVVPEDPVVLKILGNPRMVGRSFRNPFGDRVEFSLVTAGMFENYHDPTVCVGGGDYRLTASVDVPIDAGAARARAMMFRHRRDPNHRIVMWYWQQFEDGSTDTESRMGNFRDFSARFRTGYSAIVAGKKTVLIRVFAPFDIRRDSDAGLAQAQVAEIARAVHRGIKERP